MKMIVGFALGAIFIAASLFTFRSYAVASEMPDYKVIEKDGDIEIRDYPATLIAEVTVSGDRETAGSRSFQKLGGFIFGNNVSKSKVAMTAPVTQTPQPQYAQSTKIDMTAPVTQTPAGSDRWVVNFMMPSEYTMDTLPVPTDPDITIRETAPYRAVTIRFSGRAGRDSLERHTRALKDYIVASNLTVNPVPDYAFYDAPFVPGPLRRNEVHFRIIK